MVTSKTDLTIIPVRYNFSSDPAILDNASKANIGDIVVINHKTKGQFVLSGKVDEVLLCYIHLQTKVGETIQKHIEATCLTGLYFDRSMLKNMLKNMYQ